MSCSLFSALAFDLDGVIINSHPAHQRAWRDLLVSLGRELSDSELDYVLEGRKREEILRHFLGELRPEQVAELGARKDELYEAIACEVPAMPGVLGFLSEVEKLDLAKAIATSASAVRARRTLDRLGLLNRFAAVVTGSDVPAGKPDPAIYKLVVERLGKSPEAVLAFEDSTSGVAAAKRAGMPCVAVCPRSRAPQLLRVGADLWVSSFEGLSLRDIERGMNNDTG